MFYLSYAGYEVKKWLRDPLARFMIIYPLLLGLVGRFVVPIINDQTLFDLSVYYHVILAFLVLIVPRVLGAIAAFSILDDREDNILYSVQVAPLSLAYFIGLKLVLIFVVGFAGAAFVLWFADLVPLSSGLIAGVSLLAALGGPLTALGINCVAGNKVEGFAAVKGLNTLLFFPIIGLFFFDWKEFLFAIEPGFWAAKALSTAILPPEVFQLSFAAYYTVGLLYALAAVAGAYAFFARKVQS